MTIRIASPNLHFPRAPRRHRLGLLLGLAGLTSTADAAIYCAENLSQLRSALAAADGDGVDDTIRVVQGTFAVTVGSLETFVAAGEDLTIEGGWLSVFGPCNQLTNDASLSVLDGLAQRQVLRIEGSSGNGHISVRNLTIRNGRRASGGISAAGLTIEATAAHSGSITVERVYFLGNSSNQLGAALFVDGRADVTVRNSVFVGNDGTTAVALRAATPQTAYINNNTISFNFASEANTNTAAVGFNGPARFLNNNILYFNTTAGQKDLGAGAETTLISNDIQALSGAPSGLSVGNVSVDPQFRSSSNLRLRDNSPLINLGNSSALGGVGTLDAEGNPRVTARVDVGAFESDRHFASGFE